MQTLADVAWDRMTKMTALNVSGNRLRDASGIASAPALRTLNLSFNL